jgi:phage terminase small subunit
VPTLYRIVVYVHKEQANAAGRGGVGRRLQMAGTSRLKDRRARTLAIASPPFKRVERPRISSNRPKSARNHGGFAIKPLASPSAPAHLKPETAAWWTLVLEDYDLQPHHIRLLTAAATAWDRADQAREAIELDGPYQRDRYGGFKSHPALAVERDSRLAFARLLRELSLEDSPGDSRPPRISGRYAS